MTRFAAWAFDDDQEARRIELLLGRLAAQEKLMLGDGRVVVWPTGDARPAVRRIYSVPLTAALDDILWGLLLGQILYGADTPVIEPLHAIGVDREVIERLRKAVTQGRSALIVVGDAESIDQLSDALPSQRADPRGARPS